MGCSWSSHAEAVEPLRPGALGGAEDEETGSKLDGRGDSAVSKGTTDSGVVIEDGLRPALPGEVPQKPPSSTRVFDRNRQEGIQLQSSKILDELENQGIIPVGRRAGAAGEAYSITLEDGEAVRRRPPVRLASLKAAKEQRLPSREECEEKMRLVEERRKLKENELKTRLRAKSARVRVPAPGAVSEAGEDAAPGPGAWTDQRVSTDLLGPASLGQVERGEAEGAERERERCHDVRVDGEKEEGDREEEEEEEELTQVVELMHELYDSRGQSPENKEPF